MKEQPFFQRRSVRVAAGAALAVSILLFAFWPELRSFYRADAGAVRAVGVGLYVVFGFALTFFALSALVSQFVLPVQTLEERRRMLGRLLLYIFDKHGPALFVKNAELMATEEELERRGPGIILVDSSSAVALQTDKKPDPPKALVRVAGPGIVFMDEDERVRKDDVLDLRRQVRSATNVLGLTREGIEVKATVTVIFSLEPPKEKEVNRSYPFNPESAFKAVYGRAVGAEQPIRWTDLPVVVAKEIYRDMLSRETLDHLFSPTPSESAAAMVNFQKAFAGEVKENPLLKGRGIQVVTASVGSFSFRQGEAQAEGVKSADGGKPEEARKDLVFEQRLETWKAGWERREQETRAGGDLQAERIKSRARIEAQQEWVARLAGIMQTQGTESRRVVALRLFQALEMAASDPSTRKLMPGDAINMFISVRDWLKLND